MCCFRCTISAVSRKEVARHLRPAQHLGHVRQTKYCLAILAVIDGQSVAQAAVVLRVHEKTVMTWLREFCCYGCQGAPHRTPSGRPPPLPPPHKAAPVPWLEAGPLTAASGSSTTSAPSLSGAKTSA